MSDPLSFMVDAAHAGERIDVALSAWLQALEDVSTALQPTRSKVRKWIEEGLVTLDAQRVEKPSHRLHEGAMITVAIPPVEPLNLEPDSSISIDVVFEDEHLLVLNKQPGLIVHPGAGARSATLIHGLLAYLGAEFAVGEAFRPGIVHRLDKDTSGLMVVAKHDEAYQKLVVQFLSPRTITRRYLAAVHKVPKGGGCGSISKPIGRSEKDRKKMAVTANGKLAVSHWTVIESFNRGALLSVALETGRTHQIRVHLQSEGAPIFGDPLYGASVADFPGAVQSAVSRLGRQALHAQYLEFIHPMHGELRSFESQPPADITQLLETLRAQTR